MRRGAWAVVILCVTMAGTPLLSYLPTAAPSAMSHGPLPLAVRPVSSPGPNWVNLSIPDSKSPPPRIDGSMAWDAADGYAILFGGEYLNPVTFRTTYYNDTWSYVGGVWDNLTDLFTPGDWPSARFGSSMAYDAADGYVVLFGGVNAEGRYLNDTWTYARGAWTNVTSAAAPPAGFWSSMAYDAATSSMVLFGGINQSTEYGNGTWSFHAGTWMRLAPAELPPGRHAQGMTYDAADSELVMFGGEGAVDYLNDTWTYSAGTWSPVTASPHPGARVGPGLVYDSAQSAVVLYGGSPAPFDYYTTWLFSGGTWVAYNTTLAPPNPTNPWGQMVYDPVDGYVLLFYEVNGEGPNMQSWALTFTAPTSPLTVGLSVHPSSIVLGSSTNVSATASGGTAPYVYSYAGLPAGCASRNLANFTCTPNSTATLGVDTITVTVQDSADHRGQASANLTITSTPAGTASSSSSSGWEWILLLVAAVVVVLLVVIVVRRRRPPPPAPPPPPPPP